MTNTVIYQIRMEIEKIITDKTEKENILKVFDNYSRIISNFYEKAYEVNSNIANDYLKQSIKLFINRLKQFESSKDEIYQYLNYILNNIDLFDEVKLIKEPREKRERLIELYDKVTNSNYIGKLYEEILTHSSKTIPRITFDLYSLARYMGYTDEINDDENSYSELNNDAKNSLY